MSAAEILTGAPVALKPLNSQRASEFYEEFSKNLKELGEDHLVETIEKSEELRSFLSAVFDLSPYLRDICLISTEVFVDLTKKPLEDSLQALLQKTKSLGLKCTGEPDLMAVLRNCKRKVSLLCGLADLGGWWTGEKVTRALSDFADAAISASFDFILLEQANAGNLCLADPEKPQSQSGLIVFTLNRVSRSILFANVHPAIIVVT